MRIFNSGVHATRRNLTIAPHIMRKVILNLLIPRQVTLFFSSFFEKMHLKYYYGRYSSHHNLKMLQFATQLLESVSFNL